jgi:hypothetical protein
MKDEMERIWEEVAVTYLRYDSGIGLEGFRNTMESLIQEIRCLGRGSIKVRPHTNLECCYCIALFGVVVLKCSSTCSPESYRGS